MLKKDGVGLAAAQVGEKIRLIAVNGQPPKVLINPRIIWEDFNKETDLEGCLSLPDDWRLPINRSRAIKVLYNDLSGRRCRLKVDGLEARTIQHETDHLNGLLITDRLTNELKILNQPLLVFLGQREFGEAIKKALVKANYRLIDLTADDLESLKNHLEILRPQLIVVANYGYILPTEIIKIPKHGCLNIHPSLLPKYRGATPIQAAILDGAAETGVTIIKLDEKIDHGGIIVQEKTTIEPNEDAIVLGKKLAKLGGRMLVKILPAYLIGQLRPQPQDESQASRTKKINKEDGLIDWSKSEAEVDRHIRAMAGWPGAYTILPDNTRLLIHQAHLENDKLVLDIVQRAGKKPLKWADFQRGWHPAHPAERDGRDGRG